MISTGNSSESGASASTCVIEIIAETLPGFRAEILGNCLASEDADCIGGVYS